MPRFRDNRRVLVRCYSTLVPVVRERGSVPPAAEWLVDNFHVVENALGLVSSDLPRRFYRKLPKLASGRFEGYPRVLGLMDALASLTDSHFDVSALRQFVGAFQSVQPLTIGELWSVPTTFRVVLLERLRQLAESIAVPAAAEPSGRAPAAAAATDVAVRNIITSLRALTAFEVADFFESVSLVDAVLRAGSDFAAMDFPS